MQWCKRLQQHTHQAHSSASACNKAIHDVDATAQDMVGCLLCITFLLFTDNKSMQTDCDLLKLYENHICHQQVYVETRRTDIGAAMPIALPSPVECYDVSNTMGAQRPGRERLSVLLHCSLRKHIPVNNHTPIFCIPAYLLWQPSSVGLHPYGTDNQICTVLLPITEVYRNRPCSPVVSTSTVCSILCILSGLHCGLSSG